MADDRIFTGRMESESPMSSDDRLARWAWGITIVTLALAATAIGYVLWRS